MPTERQNNKKQKTKNNTRSVNLNAVKPYSLLRRERTDAARRSSEWGEEEGEKIPGAVSRMPSAACLIRPVGHTGLDLKFHAPRSRRNLSRDPGRFQQTLHLVNTIAQARMSEK